MMSDVQPPTGKEPVLHIAITMAGAVSAGSYTAGVMDYLVEALAAWEEAKQSGDSRIPQHKVCIELLNGTSAGGMTAVIAATALQDSLISVSPSRRQQASQNKLYSSWVDITGEGNLLPKMLQTNDINDDLVPSLLNSSFIDDLANKVITQASEGFQAVRRPYIDPNLEVMVTLTSLSGLPYSTFFGPDVREAFVATNHLDYGHFVLNQDKADDSGRIPINLTRKEDCQLLRESAMATGAFPIGLAARPVTRLLSYIKANPYINLNHPEFNQDKVVDPYKTMNVDGGVLNNEPFDRAEEIFKRKFDGIKPNSAIEGDPTQHAHNFNYTVLMIDPFPAMDFSEKKLDVADIDLIIRKVKQFTRDTSVINAITAKLKGFEVNNRILSLAQIDSITQELAQVTSDQDTLQSFTRELRAINEKPQKKLSLPALAGLLFGAARNQLLFKKEAVQKAYDPMDYSRFMIVPKRFSQNGNQKISGSKAIACGSFGGFGGFMDKSFREHDFYLGRMNCKRFLQQHFGIPQSALAQNPIFKDKYSPQAVAAFGYSDPQRQLKDEFGNITPLPMVPIIPLVNEVLYDGLKEPDLPWPNISESKIYALRDDFKKRSRAVLNGLFKPKSRWWRPVVKLGVWVFDGKVADTIIETIIDNFREHRLLEPTNDVSKDF